MTHSYFCPACKKVLDNQRETLACFPCGASYEIKNSVAIFEKNISKKTEEYWDAAAYTNLIEPYLVEFFPKGKIFDQMLDLGCGDGRSTVPLLGISNHIYGIDSSYHYMLDLARRSFGTVTLVNGDAKNLPFPNDFFDAAVSLSVVEHIAYRDMQAVFTEVWRVLKPNALFLVRNDAWFYSVLEHMRIRPGRLGMKPDVTHINMMTGYSFARALRQAGFKIIQEDHFPFYRFEKKYGIRVPNWLGRIFATHSNFMCVPNK